jgi:4,5-dihydroxyphthalate decarboxylase
MAPLPITLACGPYDRTRALADGRVRVAGADVRYVRLDPEEIFFRMLTYGEFDVSEMSLSTYLLTHQAGGPFVAIPVFPSRMFRHTGVYVNRARLPGSTDAAEAARALAGATVGLAEYQLTANVWIRGILAEHYGVPAASVRYRTGGLNSPGRHEKFTVTLPPEIDIAPIPAGRTLSAMLADGELDAVYSPRAPASFNAGTGNANTGSVGRLFADTRAEEERYFAATGIFPVMHVIVIHRRVYEGNRWLARELLKSFTAAKQLAYEELARTVALSASLPFVREEYERTVATMGADYWAYGIEANQAVLSTFARYAAEQHLIAEAPEPGLLFAPETREEFII